MNRWAGFNAFSFFKHPNRHVANGAYFNVLEKFPPCQKTSFERISIDWSVLFSCKKTPFIYNSVDFFLPSVDHKALKSFVVLPCQIGEKTLAFVFDNTRSLIQDNNFTVKCWGQLFSMLLGRQLP